MTVRWGWKIGDWRMMHLHTLCISQRVVQLEERDVGVLPINSSKKA
ncbi:hypothetical protein [Yoonia sp. 2307UL14-13]